MPPDRRVKVAMVDDHPAFRLGLARLLERDAGVELAWSAGSVAQAVRTLERNPVDLVLLDLRFGDAVDGIDSLKIIRRRWPETRVLVVSAFVDRQTAAAVRAAGALGIVAKDAPLPDLYAAIKQAAARREVRPSNRALKQRVSTTPPNTSERLSSLTRRELQVLEEIRSGLTNREIAFQLGVSTTTVNKHVHRVLAKLGARNRAHAAIAR